MALNKLWEGHLFAVWELKHDSGPLPCSAWAGNGCQGTRHFATVHVLKYHESTPTSRQIGFGITNNCYPVGKFINNEDWHYFPTFPGHVQCRPKASLLGRPTAVWAARYKGWGRWCTRLSSPSWKHAEQTAVRGNNLPIAHPEVVSDGKNFMSLQTQFSGSHHWSFLSSEYQPAAK